MLKKKMQNLPIHSKQFENLVCCRFLRLIFRIQTCIGLCSFMNNTLPNWAAAYNGVNPSLFVKLTFAPIWIKVFSAFSWPKQHNQWICLAIISERCRNIVQNKRKRNELPSLAAAINGVSPFLSAELIFASFRINEPTILSWPINRIYSIKLMFYFLFCSF